MAMILVLANDEHKSENELMSRHKHELKQECIPVGCVPGPRGGVPGLGGVPGPRGVPGWGGVCSQRGVPGPGGVCSRGVYLVPGGVRYSPPREQNHTHL